MIKSLMLALALIVVDWDGDLSKFQSSDIVYVGYSFTSVKNIENETKAFVKANTEWQIEKIEEDRAILKWITKPSNISVPKLFKHFERVVPGGSKER